jgi:hypothetical protein
MHGAILRHGGKVGMPRFTLTHEIDCDVDAFWKVFFDKDFNQTMYSKILAFPKYEVMELRDEENQIVRRITATPKMDVPGPVAKALGSSFSYVEEGTFDKKAKTYRWKSIPSAMKEKIRNEGVVRAEPAGEGRCRRVSDFDYEVKVFGIGGLIEGALEKNLRAGWNRGAEFTNEWLKGKR